MGCLCELGQLRLPQRSGRPELTQAGIEAVDDTMGRRVVGRPQGGDERPRARAEDGPHQADEFLAVAGMAACAVARAERDERSGEIEVLDADNATGIWAMRFW